MKHVRTPTPEDYEMYEITPKLLKHIQIVGKWKIFNFKSQQRNGTFHKNCRGKSILIHLSHVSVHFPIDPAQCEACQNPHGRGL